MRVRKRTLLPFFLVLAIIVYYKPLLTLTFWTSTKTTRQSGWLPTDKADAISTSQGGNFILHNASGIELSPANEMRHSGRATAFIFSQMRSGSSFVGEIFNQHPGSFYLFEPLWATLFYNNGTYNVPKWQSKMLKGVTDCKFEGLEDIMEFFITTKHFGGFKKSTPLRKLCGNHHKRDFVHQDNYDFVISKKCPIPKVNFTSVLNEACAKSKLNVAKIIRINDINLFEEIVENGSTIEQKVKIIHLIRDPRAVIASRIRVYNLHRPGPFSGDLVDKKAVKALCKRMVENVQTQDGVPNWLLGHYALIRYEDVAMAPVAMTERLYHFIGTEGDDAVFDWLEKNTNAKKPDESPYSLKRNSRDTVDAWRRNLSLSAVLKIQNICRDALKMFGYRTVRGGAELTNLSLSLVGDMEDNLVQIS
ncbi:carbohydrate sulfotransferase 1-like [Branchiostoma lanceolatum]|uniref:carbohydrate sulfotransferase 1-like n=1 Tax=Branchiostoma lanceolatum TaxID=7740 RepID=UPI003452ACB2